MAVRVVLAVALAVALVGASTPAIERARVDAANARVGSEVAALLEAARQLRAKNDPVPADAPGARVRVTLALPGATWGRTGIDSVAIGNGTVSWRVDGGTRHVRRSAHPLHGRGRGPAGTLVIDASGPIHLELRLVDVEGRETVVVGRGFISEDGPSPGHVWGVRADRRGGRLRV